ENNHLLKICQITYKKHFFNFVKNKSYLVHIESILRKLNMESNNTSLLPYLLSLLGRQSNFCSSIDELCDQVQDLIMEDVIGPYGTLRRAVKFAVAMGVNLGLLSLSDKRVRMPFKLSPKRPATLKTIAKQNQSD
ncbi:CG17261, partial [Drosophila busckii]